MIELQSLSAGYGGASVLQDISLTVPAGQLLILVGPNGCGKSTLLKALAGLLPPMEGRILLNGQDAAALTSRQRAQTVAYLPQSRPLPELTALQLVLHGRFPYLGYPRRYKSADWDLARQALEIMDAADLAERSLSSLSGGQRQKVYLAMLLAQDTPVVLLDEPTTFLDVSHQLQLLEQARKLADGGKTVLAVLHDLPLAMETADRLAVLSHGRLAAVGDPETVYQSGCLDAIFRVGLRRFRADDGWHYYYERRSDHGPFSPVP